MHLAIVFGIFALLLTWMLAEHVYRSHLKMRLFVWLLVFLPFVLLVFGYMLSAFLAACSWFSFVIIVGLNTIFREQRKWDALKPICDDCGKVYANKKHISVSNWQMMTYVESRESVLVCYQCYVRHYT